MYQPINIKFQHLREIRGYNVNYAIQCKLLNIMHCNYTVISQLNG